MKDLGKERIEQNDAVKILQNKFIMMEHSQEDVHQLAQRLQEWVSPMTSDHFALNGFATNLDKDPELVSSMQSD